MVAALEPVALVSVAAAIISLIVHLRLANRSGSGLFAYILLIVAAIAVGATAAALAPGDPAAQALADSGLLLAGTLAFAASGWLFFAFGLAGEAGDR